MAEHILLDRHFERSTQAILDRIRDASPRPASMQLWLFEDQAARQALTQALGELGVVARVHSAYKPLLHYFLEEVDLQGLSRVQVTYPVHPACNPIRFRLETYPLGALLAGIPLSFEPQPVESVGDQNNTWYQVQLHYGPQTRVAQVYAPNRICRDFLGQTVCAPCAWVTQQTGAREVHGPLDSEYQQCYDAVMQAVKEHEWGSSEPYFDRLVIEARLPGIERPIPIGHETLSMTEAMHEDLYFSLLEFFVHHSGRPAGSRGLQPGQIIPDIRLDPQGVARVRVFFEAPTVPRDDQAILPDRPPFASGHETLATLVQARAPLSKTTIREALGEFEGNHFAFSSRQHRPVVGVHQMGHCPAVLISGAQHANETTGVVGALRAADQLRHDPGAHFVLMPLENPDGYTLHQALRKHNPSHMLHAARYSALGDDIEYRQHAPWFERRARQHAFAVSRAQLHLNLHGYPAHEWTRPSTGYLPRGFELWSVPKGFFLILRYAHDRQGQAMALLDHVTQQLADNAELLAYNTRQIATYRQHTDALPFEIRHGIPCMTSEVDHQDCPVTLITEFPDETIAGDAFVFGHTVQMLTVLAAVRWWWRHA